MLQLDTVKIQNIIFLLLI